MSKYAASRWVGRIFMCISANTAVLSQNSYRRLTESSQPYFRVLSNHMTAVTAIHVGHMIINPASRHPKPLKGANSNGLT